MLNSQIIEETDNRHKWLFLDEDGQRLKIRAPIESPIEGHDETFLFWVSVTEPDAPMQTPAFTRNAYGDVTSIHPDVFWKMLTVNTKYEGRTALEMTDTMLDRMEDTGDEMTEDVQRAAYTVLKAIHRNSLIAVRPNASLNPNTPRSQR